MAVTNPTIISQIDCPVDSLREGALFKFEEVPVYINDDEEFILATSATLSTSISAGPDYFIGTKTSNYIAESHPAISLELQYFAGFRNPFFNAIKNNGSVKVFLGGVELGTGYVSSFSLNGATDTFITCSSTIVFYQDPTGIFSGKGIDDTLRRYIATEKKNAQIPHSNTSSIDFNNKATRPLQFFNYIQNLSYNYSVDILPCLRIGEIYPTEINFGAKTIDASVEGEFNEQFVNIYPNSAELKINLKDLCSLPLDQKQHLEYVKTFYYSTDYTYECNGKILSYEAGVSTDATFGTSKLVVKEYA